VQETLSLIGPYLAAGLSYREIGAEVGKSEDWISSRVAEIRRALIAEALKRADEMDARLRARLEELQPGSTADPAGGGTSPAPPTA
jgi:hypothetical protein